MSLRIMNKDGDFKLSNELWQVSWSTCHKHETKKTPEFLTGILKAPIDFKLVFDGTRSLM